MSKALTVRLSEETIAQLKEIAKADLRTIGKTIEFLVREHLAKEETIDEYYAREKPYIDHALKQGGKASTVEEIFGNRDS